MPIDPKSLPQNPEELKKIVVDLTAQLDREQSRAEKLEKMIRDLNTVSKKSEQLSRDQLHLFATQAVTELSGVVNATDAMGVPETPAETSNDKPAGLRRGRKPLSARLERERVEHDLTEAEKHCESCGEDLRPIGEEVSERYEYLPARMLVIEDACKKYACQCTVKTATKPPQPIEKSTAGASLLAQVITGKFADHLPLHRQGKMFRRLGVNVADQTMGGWMRQCAELMEPLYLKLKDFVLSSKVVGTDDTGVKVLDRALEGTRTGRIWPYVGDRDHVAAVYDYTPNRSRDGPEEFLKNFQGYLQVDAYAAYDAFFKEPYRGMVEVACWAHARRHFLEAAETEPVRMQTVLLLIAQLYKVEKTGREQNWRGEELRLLRESASKPVLAKLEEYLKESQLALLPKSEAGKAVAYALNNWDALKRYCEDGDLLIDNNGTERSLRCFAVGRNNWTFFGSDRGGKTAAVLRSFVTSCELVKLDPFAWFQDVLGRIGEHPVNRIEELLPHRWAAAQQ